MSVELKNFVGVYRNAFSPEYCNLVIQYFENMKANGFLYSSADVGQVTHLRNDKVVYGHGIEELQSKYALPLVTELNNNLWNNLYAEYLREFGILETSDKHHSYAFKVQKTEVGGGYHVWHYESSTRETANRLLAWILYLNDVEEGGETEFLYYPSRIKATQGTFVLFPAAFTHTHRGNPPISNSKYIATGWIEF